MITRTYSAAETQHLGKTASQKLQPGDVVALYGELGSGKTTFMQGLLEGLGVSQRITSPTFVFMKLYKIPNNRTVFHFDLYRIATEQDIIALGVPEVLADPHAITCIEWPEKMGSLLPKTAKKVVFTDTGSTERSIDADWF